LYIISHPNYTFENFVVLLYFLAPRGFKNAMKMHYEVLSAVTVLVHWLRALFIQPQCFYMEKRKLV